jgi:cysteinyl-tRNA synthetase
VVIDSIDEAIKRTNIYLEFKDKKTTLLSKAYSIISKPLSSMGLDYSAQEKEESNETAIINATTKFRDEIRVNAKSDFKKILEICDRFRDYDMVDLSIRLEDKKVGEASTWKFESRDILIK